MSLKELRENIERRTRVIPSTQWSNGYFSACIGILKEIDKEIRRYEFRLTELEKELEIGEVPTEDYCMDCDKFVQNYSEHSADHTIRRIPRYGKIIRKEIDVLRGFLGKKEKEKKELLRMI